MRLPSDMLSVTLYPLAFYAIAAQLISRRSGSWYQCGAIDTDKKARSTLRFDSCPFGEYNACDGLRDRDIARSDTSLGLLRAAA